MVVNGTAPAAGQYYWAAIMGNDTVVSYGPPVYVPEGPFSGVELEVPISYLDSIPGGHYSIRVFSVDSIQQVGNASARKLAAEGGIVQIPNYADTKGCKDCCTFGLSRYRAFAVKYDSASSATASFTVAEAQIETRYGHLCGDSTTETSWAQMNCWVGLLEQMDKPKNGLPMWAQAGWLLGRNIPAHRSDTAFYFEFHSSFRSDPIIIVYYNAVSYDGTPQDFAAHTYRILRPDAHIVSFEFDGEVWFKDTMDFTPSGISTPFVCWQGEIRGRETDMPGTLNSPCYFNYCGCALSPDTIPDSANFTNSWAKGDTIGVTRQSGNRHDEWGAEKIGSSPTSSFMIWDVNPYVP